MSEARRFWMTMRYACVRAGGKPGCGFSTHFYLEDGCEGPRGGDSIDHALPADHPFEPGKIVQWERTPSGRLIVPVPFMAGGCPHCQPTPPWSMGRPCLVHVGHDRELAKMATELGPTDARFLYPADPMAPQACGEPIFGPLLARLS